MRNFNTPESNEHIDIPDSDFEDVNEHEMRMHQEDAEYYRELVKKMDKSHDLREDDKLKQY
jgi:hypothetical protein